MIKQPSFWLYPLESNQVSLGYEPNMVIRATRVLYKIWDTLIYTTKSV